MPAGRPTKLTPEVHATIIESVRAGNYLEPSAFRAGVSKSVVYDWIKRGAKEKERLAKNPKARLRKKEQPFVEFLDALKRAEGDAEVRDVALIANAAQTQWQAAAWRLERKHFARWGRKQAIEHSGKDGKAIKVKHGVTKEAAKQIRDRLFGVVKDD